MDCNTLLQELPPSIPEGPALTARLDVCMGPAGAPQPYHLAASGGFRWLHVHSGTLVARLYPGTTANLSAFIKHQQTAQHAALLQVEGQQVERVQCCAGQALLIPAGWLTSFEFQEPCIIVGALLLRCSCLAPSLLLPCFCANDWCPVCCFFVRLAAAARASFSS